MKYTLMGFNQEKLIELGLDMKDAIILRYFVDFKDTKKMRCQIIDGEPYHWVKYEGMAEEYPILNLNNEDSVYRRLKKLVKAGMLKHRTVKSNVSEIQDKCNNLSDKNPTAIGQQSIRGTDENPSALGCKSVPNNPSTNYPSTINNPHKEKIEKSVVNKVNELCGKVIEYLNSKAGTKYKPTTTNTAKVIKARVNEGFVLEDFYKVIDNKFLDWHGTEMEKFLRPETLFGNKFEGYLNQNISSGKGKVVPFKTESNSISNARMYKSLD